MVSLVSMSSVVDTVVAVDNNTQMGLTLRCGAKKQTKLNATNIVRRRQGEGELSDHCMLFGTM